MITIAAALVSETHRSDAGVVREHETAHAVVGLHVRRPAGEGYLDRRWPPRNEIRELSLSDTEQRLMDLCIGRKSTLATIGQQRDGSARLSGRHRPG